MRLIKFNSLGEIIWTREYPGIPEAVKTTSDGGFIIAGSKMNAVTRRPDAYILKVDSLGLSDVESPAAESRIPIDISPNPFHGTCRITAPSGARLEVLDVLGHTVLSVPRLGRTDYEWRPPETLPAGVYVLRVTDGQATGTVTALHLK